jgi:hypothetical protein
VQLDERLCNELIRLLQASRCIRAAQCDRCISHGAMVSTISGRYQASFSLLFRTFARTRQRDLHRVADNYPELFFAGMIKLCQVTKVEVGSPGDFAKLGNKQAIIEKLEQKAGPEARKLFEQFVRDVEKLEAQQSCKRTKTRRRASFGLRVTALHSRELFAWQREHRTTQLVKVANLPWLFPT